MRPGTVNRASPPRAKHRHMAYHTARRLVITIRLAVGLLIPINLFLALWLWHDLSFDTESYPDYSLRVLRIASEIIGWLGVLLFLWAAVSLWTSPGRRPNFNEVYEFLARRSSPLRDHRRIPLITTALLVLAAFLGAQIRATQRILRVIPAAGTMLVTPDGSNVFYADSAGTVWEIDPQHPKSPPVPLSLGGLEHPQQAFYLALAPRNNLLCVLLRPAQLALVHLSNRNAVEYVPLDQEPTRLVITIDEHRAYVACIQPAPNGTIDVIDLSSAARVSRIHSVGCPIDVAVSGNDKLMYVSTECGGGRDPIYTVSVRSNKVVSSLPGFAVGGPIQLSPDGKHLLAYHSQRISVIDVRSHTESDVIPCESGMFRLTPDGHFVVAYRDSQFAIYDAVTTAYLYHLGPVRSVTDFTVTNDSVYAVRGRDKDSLWVASLGSGRVSS